MGVMLSLPVWLASNLYPIWMSYRLLEGYRILSLRSARGAQYAENSDELREAKDNMIKFWVMHATLRLLGSVVSRGTFAMFSLWLLMYDTAGAAKLYNYFLRPLLANRDSQIETTAEKVYTSAVEMWYRPTMALVAKAQTVFNNLME
eukprot:INCI3938.1.p1 GENE.INCI3938.1~~INCI3938.1.p1  ORF type:complete len:147 (-),score=21.30 INCI3938.1:49-489(-)